MPTKKNFRETVFEESKNVASEMLKPSGKTPAKEQVESNAPRPVNARHWEKKSRSVQLLLPPSLHERVKMASDASGARSFNDYVNSVLELAHPVG
jgi:predicted HicB family RNase H-like nuclease